MAISVNMLDDTLLDKRELIEQSVIKRSYLPLYEDDRPVLLGCGCYGCVYKTKSKNVVLKVTTDLRETKFVIAAMNLGEWPEGLVQYYQIIVLDSTVIKDRDQICALWREKAFFVGKISVHNMSKDLRTLLSIISRCKYLSDVIRYYDHFSTSPNFDNMRPAPKSVILQEYLDITESNVGEFNSILHAMNWYARHGILFGDLHLGNIGSVRRKENDNKYVWAIIDPGESVFVDDRYDELFGEYGL